MTAEQKRAYVIADNKLAENAGWDTSVLSVELRALMDLDLEFDIGTLGFETAETRQQTPPTRAMPNANPIRAIASSQLAGRRSLQVVR